MSSAPARSADLNRADAHCRRMAQSHYENFWVSGPFLPRPVRRHLARIYAYSRTTDDLGDESAGAGPARLAAWRAEVEAMLAGAAPADPVLVAIRASLAELAIPGRLLTDLIAANEQDQVVTSYPTWADLRAYCMLSAAPVGRLVLRVFGAVSPEAERLSDEVCIGLQVANFAQDVSVDRARGRCYLLGPELEAGGVAGAVELHCHRAARLLAAGRRLQALVPGRLRVQLALYRLGGEAILDAVRATGYRTDQHRPRIGAAAKLRLVPAAALSLLKPAGGGGPPDALPLEEAR